MKQMKMFLVILGVLMFTFGTVSIAAAVPVTATLTADNHYALYYGNAGGVTLVGHNELNATGENPIDSVNNPWNWSQAETWDFNIPLGDYIYVAAWDGGQVARGLIGQFVFGSGSTLTTDTLEWEVYQTLPDIDVETDKDVNLLADNSIPPTTGDIEGQIAQASWDSITDSIAYGGVPWGNIDNISHEAQWIWGRSLQFEGTEIVDYQLFRTKVPVAPVPEPATMFLVGTGLIGLAGLTRKKLFNKS